jgi:hypothetical protein
MPRIVGCVAPPRRREVSRFRSTGRRRSCWLGPARVQATRSGGLLGSRHLPRRLPPACRHSLQAWTDRPYRRDAGLVGHVRGDLQFLRGHPEGYRRSGIDRWSPGELGCAAHAMRRRWGHLAARHRRQPRCVQRNCSHSLGLDDVGHCSGKAVATVSIYALPNEVRHKHHFMTNG